MLVWSAVLAAALAIDTTTRISPDPSVTITVDSSRKQLVLTAGPFDLPNMPPMDEHAMMDRSMSHDTPIRHFDWPIEGWLRGFELELRDGQGNPVPRRVIHHMIMVNFSRRMLLYPAPERLFGAGTETGDIKVPKTIDVMRARGIPESTIQTIVWDNPVAFFAQSGQLDLSELAERPVVDRAQKFETNSVLRGDAGNTGR